MAPRRKLTYQPRHTNKGAGGFSRLRGDVGNGHRKVGTHRPGDPNSLDLFCFVIALGGTNHDAKEYGLWGARLTKISAMPFFSGVVVRGGDV